MARRIPKRVAQQRHAQRRLIERFGIELGTADLTRLADRIAAGDATYVEPGRNGCAIYELEHDGHLLRLVYDRRRRTIVTAKYPPD